MTNCTCKITHFFSFLFFGYKTFTEVMRMCTKETAFGLLIQMHFPTGKKYKRRALCSQGGSGTEGLSCSKAISLTPWNIAGRTPERAGVGDARGDVGMVWGFLWLWQSIIGRWARYCRPLIVWPFCQPPVWPQASALFFPCLQNAQCCFPLQPAVGYCRRKN